jgi:hypothetical protein
MLNKLYIAMHLCLFLIYSIVIAYIVCDNVFASHLLAPTARERKKVGDCSLNVIHVTSESETLRSGLFVQYIDAVVSTPY